MQLRFNQNNTGQFQAIPIQYNTKSIQYQFNTRTPLLQYNTIPYHSNTNLKLILLPNAFSPSEWADNYHDISDHDKSALSYRPDHW